MIKAELNPNQKKGSQKAKVKWLKKEKEEVIIQVMSKPLGRFWSRKNGSQFCSS